ncbi:hypothetical protein [Undibacterium sp. TJN19]|uniref:hypothetical protein n=1 Tax=Undibacterium sp. TJN19 TaxID=3413055 RepID=UPI003BF1D76D
MNLDLLKAEWTARDARLEQALSLNTNMLRLSLVEQHRREIAKWGWVDKYELIVGVPVCIYLIWFLLNFTSQVQFALPCALMLLWTMVFPILNHKQRHRLQALDFSTPIMSLQKQLGELKAARLRLLKWAFLLGQIVWFIPFLLVFFKGVLGVDLYVKTQNFIFPNLVFGIVFIPAAIGISKLLSGRLGRSGRFQEFTDMLAGKDFQHTRLFLEKLQQFEQLPEDDDSRL